MSDSWTAVAPSPRRVLEDVTATVADLDDTLWAARPPRELLDTVQALERLRSVLDAVELRVVAEVDATEAAKSDGWGSTKDFLTAVSGGRKGAGRATVALARAVTTERGATGHVLGLGAISRAQAEVVVGAVERLPVDPALRDAAERVLLDEARTRDATELARTGRHVQERLDPEGVERREERALEREERSAHLGRFLSLSEDGIGGVRLRGRGTVEDAAWITNALLPLASPRPTGEPASPAARADCGGALADRVGVCGVPDCAHDGRDPREHGTRMWDALVDASRVLAGADLVPTSHGASPRITVALDHDTLVGRLRSRGHALLDDGATLSAAAVRRLACDAEILPIVLGSRSQVLDVGRSQRLVTLGLWLALVARDRHCAFPGCSRVPLACDAHHVVHWADGGATSLDNLVLLCRTHHTLIHHTPWAVRLDPVDRRPEFLPPARLDPDRSPLRRRPLRE